MKIAILSFYSGLIDRGVEIWASLIKEKFGGKKFEIEVMGGEKFGSKINWNAPSEKYWRGLVLLHVLYTLPRWIKSDLVIPTNGTLQSLICRLVTWIFGKPMVVFGHSGPGADDKFNLLCSPNVFVAFSSYQKEWAENHRLPWTKVIYIPHVVDMDRFTPAVRKPKKRIVLCVAANTPDKRVGLVKEAAKLAKCEFLAVGKGNPIEVPHDLMPDIYKKADVFCFVPQPWEAFGLVFLEALAANLPIVTINDSVRREIVGDAGIFVENPENVKDLSEAINLALRTKWGNKPRKQAEKFSWDNVLSKYEELFNSLRK